MKLSPFGILFLLLIALSPHSFAKHALHKRMERDGVDGLRHGTSALNTPPTNVAISIPDEAHDASHERHVTIPVDDDHVQGEPPKYLHLMVPYQQPQINEIGSSKVDKKRKWHTDDEPYPRKKSSTNAPDDSHEQTIPVEKIALLPGFYSHTSDLEQAFNNWHSHQDIEDVIWRILFQMVLDTVWGHSRSFQERMRYWTYSITSDAISCHEFVVKEVPKANKELASRSNVIRKLLDPIDPVQHDSGVVAWLGSQLSSFNSRRLPHYRETIQHALGSSSYLSSLYGFLGPCNLFCTDLTYLLEEREWKQKLPQQFSTYDFITDIQLLRSTFASFLFYADPHSKVDGLPLRESDEDFDNFADKFVREMTDFELKWAIILGTRQDLMNLIRDIQESDLMKSLLVDLMNPTDLAGYELALVEPFGIGPHEPSNKVLSDTIGASSALMINPVFHRISQEAQANAKLRISTARKALKLKDSLLLYLTPSGLQDFLTHLKKENGAVMDQHQMVPTTH